jgi:hypothetical protein
MARLYADEDFDYPIVEELRHLGHDVLTVQEAGQGNQATPDDAVLSFRVMEDIPQRVPVPRPQAADTMPQVDAINTAGALYGAMMHGKDHSVSLAQRHHLRP